MDTLLVVVLEAQVGLEQLKAQLNFEQVGIAGRVLSVCRDALCCHLVTVDDSDAVEVFSDWPTPMIPSRPVSVISVDYRDPEFAADLIGQIAAKWDVLVDNNFGLVVSGAQLMPTMLSGN